MSLTYLMKQQKFDLFHGLKNVVPPVTATDSIVTVHDTFDVFGSKQAAVYWSLVLERYIKRANKVVTVSNNTKNSILQKYGIDRDNVEVIYHGYRDDIFYQMNADLAREKLKKEYPDISFSGQTILNVGTLKRNKNQKRLVSAVSQLNQNDLELIIVGRDGGYKSELEDHIKHCGVSDMVHLVGYIPRDHLRYMYNCSTVFCFPSLFEGFGLPPLEAMACGTPVVASNTSSIPEVIGDAGILIDPYNISEIASGIVAILDNDKMYRQLKKSSVDRAKKFSWDQTASQTVDVYEEVCEAHS